MTDTHKTPRLHADKATLFHSDDRMLCWTRLPGGHGGWHENASPAFDDPDIEYYVGLTPPSRTIKVGSREINAPLDVAPVRNDDYWFIDSAGDIVECCWEGGQADNKRLARGNVWATEADATAARDAWCELMKGQV